MRRLAALVVGVALLAAACERGGDAASPSGSASASASASGSSSASASASVRPTLDEAPGPGLPDVGPQALVRGDAAEAMGDLCVAPELLVGDGGEAHGAGPAPPAIVEVEDQVAELRGLDWRRPVVADPIDDREMDRRIDEAFDGMFPADQYDRRTLAWRTIGAIGAGDDLREALLAFGRGQVVGFYDPQDGELVYLADDGPLGLTEKAVLAHELVHAIDDQHFDLRRIDTLASGCRDEELAAALAVVEGSAQHFATQVLLKYPAPIDEGLLDALGDAAATEDVPAFVERLQLLPYTEGQRFVSSVAADKGVDAVDAALRDLPPTTEQILHPERWPGDRPTAVELPDLGARLPGSWRDLDVMQVGELWLRELLALRLDEAAAAEAAAGWDGGVYRAWSSGGRVVVVLRTAWDAEAELEAFATAVGGWIEGAGVPAEVIPVRPRIVDVVFASDATTLEAVVGPR